MKYQAICVFNQLLDVMDSIQIAVNVKHRVVFQCNIPFINKERKGLDRYNYDNSTKRSSCATYTNVM